jgi:prolyl-tRNA synthetase
MRQSKLFGKTLREDPRDVVQISQKLLHRGGFVRESSAGRYYFLPLGWRVHQKIQAIIKEEMDQAGAEEMITPVLHPIELWKETNRTNSVGFELMKIKDRNEMEFVLGGTAEEMLVDLVRKFQVSYKDLPFHLYQFSTKFRDELRPRGGLLRLREFVMKDGYSFHETEEDFQKEYEKMKETYRKIFERLGCDTVVVESDNGYIGGEYCHEFVVESEAGESRFFVSRDGKYAAHEDVARFRREEKNSSEKEKLMREVDAKRGNTMDEGVKLHKLPLWQQIKNVMMADERGNLILGVIRGDLEVNEVKLAHLAKAYQLRPATEEEIRSVSSESGFISPVGISKRVKVIGDLSLRTIKNGYTGANKKFRDLLNVNIDRDYTLDIEGDIGLAKEGYTTEAGQPLVPKRGIEVGNIFQLGFHYSAKMSGANFRDASGAAKPYYMGCYGIGLARTLATIVDLYHDERGIVWPEAVAPFKVHLIALGKVKEAAEKLYKTLLAKGVEVLYDDRDEKTAGEKFADADLIGIPWRVVVSENTLKKKGIELKKRSEQSSRIIRESELLKKIKVA